MDDGLFLFHYCLFAEWLSSIRIAVVIDKCGVIAVYRQENEDEPIN